MEKRVDDASLWKRIAEGDAEAFDAFYRQMAAPVRSFLRRLVQNEQAAEDVMQNAFTEIWRRPSGFDPSRGSLRAYIFGVARKQAMEWWRKQQPETEFDLEIEAPGRMESSSVVADAFGRLNADQRALLWLREVEGHSYAELAAALGIPVGTVRSRLFAAREALRAVWHRTPAMKGDRG
jgi:RNA polymerase sigma-70 factor (ECF subfamily)